MGETQKIFISYRRGIDNDSAGRLFDRLVAVFPDSRVFRDVDSATEMLGLDFHEVLTERVQDCAVLVAVIGQGWIESMGRLEAETDFVRIELAAALARPGLRLIPVLVGGAEMPEAAALPGPLRPLVRRGAIKLTNEGYSKAVGTVIETIASIIGAAPQETAAAPVVPAPAKARPWWVWRRPKTHRPPRETTLARLVESQDKGLGGGVARWLRIAAAVAVVVPAAAWAVASMVLWLEAGTLTVLLDSLSTGIVPELVRP